MATIVYPTIKFYNPDLLLDKVRTYLTADSAASASTLTVENIVGIGVDDYLLLGEFGQEIAEIVRVHTSTAPSGTTITLNANTTYAHTNGTPVYRIDRNQVEFSRATTLTGSKSELSTVSIVPDELYTVYEDTSNTTGFGFARAVNSADTTYSNYSESFPYAGYGENSLKNIFDSVLFSLGYTDEHGQPSFTAKISREAAFRAAMDAQLDLVEARYRWSYLTNFDVVISEIETGQDSYSLPSQIAKEDGRASVLNVRLGGRDNMTYIDKEKLNDRRKDIVKTTLGAAITATDQTTITLTDGSDFETSGSIQVVVDDEDVIDSIAYTGKSSTNVLTGVTGIAETVSNGAVVWQGATFGEPNEYTIFEDTIVLDPPPATDWEDRNLLADLYEKPTLVDDLADETQFPAYVIKPYVAYKLTLLRYDGDEAKAEGFRKQYETAKATLILNETSGQRMAFVPYRKPNTIVGLSTKTFSDSTSESGS